MQAALYMILTIGCREYGLKKCSHLPWILKMMACPNQVKSEYAVSRCAKQNSDFLPSILNMHSVPEGYRIDKWKFCPSKDT